jgi:hypothetical protein
LAISVTSRYWFCRPFIPPRVSQPTVAARSTASRIDGLRPQRRAKATAAAGPQADAASAADSWWSGPNWFGTRSEVGRYPWVSPRSMPSGWALGSPKVAA